MGELAALAAAGCWVVSGLSFEAAGRRIGSLSLNVIRLAIALALLCVAAWFTRGLALPIDAPLRAVGWLALSGLIGLLVGDFLLFRALVVIGPRLASLVMASVPIWVAGSSAVWLGESMRPDQWLATAAIVAGIGGAVAERPAPPPERGLPGAPPPAARASARPLVGVLLALGGAWGQAGGLVLSKVGMGDYDALAATQIRVLAGLLGFVVVVLVTGWLGRLAAACRDAPALRAASLGAAFGPFVGVWLSLVAVQHAAHAGVAAALMGTTPILMIPAVWWPGERVGPAGIVGALVAVAGAIWLVL